MFATHEITAVYESFIVTNEAEYLDTTKNFRIYRPLRRYEDRTPPPTPVERQVDAARKRIRFHANIANGICTRCGLPNSAVERHICEACMQAERTKAQNRRHREDAEGRCRRCGLLNPRAPKRFCAPCAKKESHSSIASKQRKRMRETQ